jgi:hypothetical protein
VSTEAAADQRLTALARLISTARTETGPRLQAVLTVAYGLAATSPARYSINDARDELPEDLRWVLDDDEDGDDMPADEPTGIPDSPAYLAVLVGETGLNATAWDITLADGADQYRQGFAAGKRLDAAVTVAMQEAGAR